MSYPPDDHILRDLALETEYRPDATASGWLPVTPAVLAPEGGVEPGVVAILADVVGGGLSIRSVLPDWVATADLTLQLVRTDVRVGGVVEVAASVVRKGRTTLVIEVDIRDGDGGVLGWGSMTSSVLSRRDDTPEWTAPGDEVTRTAFAQGRRALASHALDAMGAAVVEPGVVSMPWSPYARNSLGAVQGGVLALLGAAAGRSALGGDGPVLDLHVVYLALARHGPVVATAEVLARGAATVRLVDAGAGDRLTTVVHVGAPA